jgi:hypothetical protein
MGNVNIVEENNRQRERRRSAEANSNWGVLWRNVFVMRPKTLFRTMREIQANLFEILTDLVYDCLSVMMANSHNQSIGHLDEREKDSAQHSFVQKFQRPVAIFFSHQNWLICHQYNKDYVLSRTYSKGSLTFAAFVLYKIIELYTRMTSSSSSSLLDICCGRNNVG